jgi:hypothetical protein
VVDWFLFYERKNVTWKYPLISVVVPLVYVVFVFIHAACFRFDTSVLNFNGDGAFIYPYFFLNIDTQGVIGVLKWIVVLLVAFIVVGFLFFGLDRLIKSPKED